MIEFESVSKTYRDGTTAVEDLSLQIPSDKVTVIVGPSGCGKTTTLRMVNRMLEPSRGRVLWDGKPMKSQRKTTLRRQMGYVIQNGGLFPHRTVIDNVTTVPGLLGWDRNKSRKRALELLNAVGLDPKLYHRFPAQLSGGQQQRVGVARALAADPIVLLMDEPFSAVDPVVRADLHELLLGLQGELSKTIVMITHDIDEAIKLGDQVAILRVGGKLAQFGTPQQLLDEPADGFVEGFIGRDRGYRALSFESAASLHLDRVRVVRDTDGAAGDEPVLVVDGDARPIGWLDHRRPGQVLGLGATFDPEADTLRAALDSALTSPVGLAVAVSHESGGRYLGVVSASDILSQITQGRADIAEQISDRQQSGPDGSQAGGADEQGASGATAAGGLAALGFGDQEGLATDERADGSGPTAESTEPAVDPGVDSSADPDVDRGVDHDVDQGTSTTDHGGDAVSDDQPDGAVLPPEEQAEERRGLGETQSDQVEHVPDPTTEPAGGERHDPEHADRAAPAEQPAPDEEADPGEQGEPTLIRAPVEEPTAPEGRAREPEHGEGIR
ncbi:osmoprotectant transport system ATP-binding protein [Friedmanniella endophytica]|uniref:ABC-type quaternary amine transporter n=1 Tax=Microlunatus kandeliicorticis TaxID=1759536 RepID=A0A7W3IQK2_9ACTN|nr:ATP-binding cassette domain-containing protein [Microlunatus kandeliicorticis]MBA8793412.1 osmoprotectant transport system ATP-binding protein [Microlunatus kandeliicorticis]